MLTTHHYTHFLSSYNDKLIIVAKYCSPGVNTPISYSVGLMLDSWPHGQLNLQVFLDYPKFIVINCGTMC